MKLFLTLLCAFPLIGMEMERVRPENIVAPKRLGTIDLRHDDNGLYVIKDGQAQPIERRQCDEVLRNIIALKKIKEFQDDEGYISVNERNNKLALEAQGRIKGGGPGGATAGFLIGKGLTYGVCYGGIWLVSLFAGPAAAPTALTAGKVATPFIELASNKVGIGLGILGGILTGPA